MLVEVKRNGERAEEKALAFLADRIMAAGEELGVQDRWMAAQIGFSVVINLAAALRFVGFVVSIEEVFIAYPEPGPLRDAAMELIKEFSVRRVE